ncbi:MAG: hypothetical protein NC924_03710 [Candidatus Omnitrophica bacterium]|nr:hypothetical protein [Candidatus Omnitrophota bacterium]
MKFKVALLSLALLALLALPLAVRAAEVVGNTVCPVSGDTIDAAAATQTTVEDNGKFYNLCCPACVEMFNAEPEKYGKIAEASVKAQ